MSHAYRAYGLTCTSNIEIPGLWPETLEPRRPSLAIDVLPEPPGWVELARALPQKRKTYNPSPPEPSDSSYSLASLGAEEYFEWSYNDGTQVVVDIEGQRVWGKFVSPLTLDDFAVYLRGPIMGFLLRRGGTIALHGSTICASGDAVVLCGPSQSGKSTTAAAMALQDIPILSDDIAALKSENGGFQIEPGYPRLCLWPDAVQHLFGAPDALPRLTPTWEKRFLPLDGTSAKFQSQRCPLRAIYLLAPRVAEARAPRVEETSPRQALLELVQNTYMNWLLGAKLRAAEFDLLSTLVVSVPVRRIVPHSDPARIAALCELLVADARGLPNRQDSAAAVSAH